MLQADEPRGSEDERVVLPVVHLPQARAEVPPNRRERRPREEPRELRGPADAARAEARRGAEARHELVERDGAVGRVGPPSDLLAVGGGPDPTARLLPRRD